MGSQRTNPPTFREAGLEDLASVAAVRQRAIRKPGVLKRPLPPSIQQSRGDLGRETVILLSICAGEIVGFVGLADWGDGEVLLDGPFIEPFMRRRGIGTRLMELAEIQAAAQAVTVLRVEACHRAEGFFVRRGFSGLEGRRRPPHQSVLMTKNIALLHPIHVRIVEL
jgi:N-acetylglutamate synthase-like GNAT family acetyltransferase